LSQSLVGIERFGVDNWAEIADYLGTKTGHECEVHYYSFYYKSADDKAPGPDDIISTRRSDGSVEVSDSAQQRSLIHVAQYILRKDPDPLHSSFPADCTHHDDENQSPNQRGDKKKDKDKDKDKSKNKGKNKSKTKTKTKTKSKGKTGGEESKETRKGRHTGII
jgi:hypothetical protein